jgi:hypothetical protein
VHGADSELSLGLGFSFLAAHSGEVPNVSETPGSSSVKWVCNTKDGHTYSTMPSMKR